jgi:hypothetical protein
VNAAGGAGIDPAQCGAGRNLAATVPRWRAHVVLPAMPNSGPRAACRGTSFEETIMRIPAFHVAAALALVLATGAAQAQGEQKHGEGKAPSAHKAAPPPHAKERHPERAPADKGHADRAKSEKAHADKAAAAERERREQAERKGLEDKRKAAESARQRKEGGADAKKVHLSEQQRDGIHQALLNEKDLRRARNVGIKPAVGKLLPRHIRIYVLPVAILAIVPAYRDYRYVVIDDEFCIVEPRTYEIVDVIPAPGRTTADARQAQAPALALTSEEQAIVLGSVNLSSDSTLGLGLLAVGTEVPRRIELHNFPEAVLEKVSKLKGYKYFSAEGRVAVVDPKHPRVVAVLGPRR